MEKLEFDSLHKFLVSLGLIFIALPFLLLIYLFNSDITLISQEEFDALSSYSQNQIQNKEYLINITLKIFPILFFLMLIVGIILLIIGIRNWKKVQKNLDGLVEADRIKHELDAAQMKQSEVLEKTVEEVKEAEPPTVSLEKSAIINHMDIEDRFFSNGIPTYQKRRYYIRRNIKIGRIEYDGIAISTSNNIDLIYEIKVWKQPRTITMLRTTLERLYKAGINYETYKQRNFKCILVIATTAENINTMRRWAESLTHDDASYDFSKIEIQYYTDELIK